MKVIDLLGNEIKVGDFVAFAPVVMSGVLRRGVIKEIGEPISNTWNNKTTESIRMKLKSIIPDGERWTWEPEYKRFPAVLQGQAEKQVDGVDGVFRFEVIRLGNINQAFSSEEVVKIIESKIKVKFGE